MVDLRGAKWWVRHLSQQAFPKATLALLANRTWVLEPEVALVPLLSRRKGVAVDAGANKGVYLFHMSRHFDRVVAFEPLPEMAAYLSKAAPGNARVEGVALSSAAGRAHLCLPHGFNELGSLEPREVWSESSAIDDYDVALATLDSYALRDVALIKIDVEGHELAVLEGARETIARFKPSLLVEIEDRHHAGAIARCRALLEGWGYAGYFLDGLAVRAMSEFDLERDQNPAQIVNSVKCGRYINNFMFFERREAAERVGAIEMALSGAGGIDMRDVLVPAGGVTAGQRLRGSWRAARDLMTAQSGR